MPTLHLQLLGNFHLLYNSEPINALNQGRLQSLLAYLTLYRAAPQARRQLAFLLWPESSEPQALTNLRKALTHLRQLAPILAQSIYAEHQVVQWRPAVPFTLDVAAFESKLEQATVAEQTGRIQEAIARWTAAVALYAGPLLPSCYDDWLLTERERLHQLCLGVLERLVASYERQHDLAAAIPYAQQLLRLDPLQESVYLQLMRLQALQGDRAGALRTYHTCATVLARELGVAPAPETQEAYARLLKLETGAPAPPHILPATQLVGRQAEWEKLLRAWRLATGQGAHFVCLWGEAGIGKTRLAEELFGWAGHQGFSVARTRAYAGEGQLVYAPVVEWLRAEPVRATRQQLAPVWLSEVVRLAPEILTEQPAVTAPAPMTERWQRQQLWEALARALLAAPQPLFLLIDDMQWCDQEMLEWLHYLLHFASRARLLVLGTARPEEVDTAHPLQTLCRHLRTTGQMTEIELGPLDAKQTALLASQTAQHALAENTQQALFRATAGNPLFIVEMVRAGLSGGLGEWERAEDDSSSILDGMSPLPPKVQAVIQARLAQLSPTARDLARLAAVIGQDFTFDLPIQASGDDEDALARGLDELWQRRIVREHGAHSYGFTHDLIGEVAYAGMSPMRRQLLHRQVAQALEQIHSHELNVVSARIATHYRQAGEAAKAAVYYFRAVQEMQFGYAHDKTIAHLRQGLAALQGLPGTEENVTLEIAMELSLGRVLTARDGWGSPAAVEAFETARRLCLASNNLAQLVRTQDYLQICYGDSGHFQRALAMAKSNVELATKLGDMREIEGAHGSLGFILFCVGEFAAARYHLEQAAALAATLSDTAHNPLTYPGAFPFVLVLWLLGYPDKAQQYLQDVLAAQVSHVGPFDLLSAYEYCIIFYYWRREWPMMQTYAQKLMSIAETYEFTTYRWLGQLYTTVAFSALERSPDESARIRQSLEELKARDIRGFIPFNLCLLAEVCMRAGQYIEGIAALDEALALELETGEHVWAAETHQLRGDLLRARGAIQDAELAYQQALAVAGGQQAKSLELSVAISLARLWQQQGRSGEAYQLLAAIYHWFTEGFDTADLQTAKALLADLEAAR